MSQFASPASNAQLPPVEVFNHLLIVKPLSIEHDVPTRFGDTDAIRCDIADLTTGILSESVLWFNGGLVSALQSRINQLVLAAMTQGQAKPGQDPPWILLDCATDPNAVAQAKAWLAQNPTFDPSRPNVQSPAPYQAPPPPTTPAYQPTPQASPAPAYQPPAPAPAQPAYQAPAAAYQPPVDPAAV